MSRRAWIVIAVAAAALVVAGLYGVAPGRSGLDDAGSPAAQGWRRYDNQRYGFSLMYPPDFAFVESGPAGSPQTEFFVGFGNPPFDGPGAIRYVVEVTRSSFEAERASIAGLPDFSEAPIDADGRRIAVFAYQRPEIPGLPNAAPGRYEVAIIPHGERVIIISSTNPHAVPLFRQSVATIELK